MSFITREEAAKRISNILHTQEPIKTGIKLPIRKGKTFSVYQIPVEYLVPNFVNDRISWRILECQEATKRKLSFDNVDDIEYVFNIIEKESPNDNERTLNDIADKGQQREGIITKDGIIIDGNRRATLIRKLFRGEARKKGKSVEDFRFFDAIVLDEDIDEKELVALETSIQIGEDKKVEYNRICLYLKVDNLRKYGYNIAQIANYMNCKEKEVQEKIDVFKLMQDYLKAIEKPNHYTLLDGLEDQFINTKTIFKKLDNNTYITEDWDYSEDDVINFKQVCYDYMRAKFEGKQYRDILLGKPNKTNGVFIQKSVWDDFLEHHEHIIEKNNPQNESDWEFLGKRAFLNNLRNANEKLSEVLKDKDITTIIKAIELKVHSLKELLEKKHEINSDDLSKLRQAQKDIYNITKQYE